ncbi:MAG TPA: uracil-DNA glycosylase family protein [Verrucomicrobiae bacterium]|nr:uracil-DNA glycosylase family protein [Verrucomicrobiae bacterium]
MDPAKRGRVEEWLRYGQELGLGPYFKDRTGGGEESAPRDSESAAANRIGFPATTRETPVPAPTLRTEPAGAATSAPAHAGISPSLAGPTLFEAAEKVKGDTLERIRGDIGDCTRCRLHQARHNIVFGVGNPKAQLVFVGEGPGHDEDMQGEPFVGRAGKLLTQMIEAMSLRREDVYICNVVKCRPPENRLPERDEIATCSPFLMRQLETIGPKVICCLGACSAQTLLQTNQGISKFRGEWFDFRGAKLIATYHPAYLLRNPNAKGEVWKDLQKVMAVLGLQPKKR